MTASQPDLTTTAGKLADLHQRLVSAQQPVGRQAVDDRHAAGLMTARERAEYVLDDGSFVETDALAKHRVTDFGLEHNAPLTDGVVTGYGTIDGRRVCLYSQDNTVFSGQMGEVYGEKICKIYDLAIKTGLPIIAIHEGTGPRHAEGIVTLAMYSKILQRMTSASGLIPQISVVTGETVGLHTFSPAVSDIVIMTRQATLRNARSTSAEAVGSAGVHSAETGLCHVVADNDTDALDCAREIIDYLPVNNMAEAPRTEAEIHIGSIQDNLNDADYGLDNLIPDGAYDTYDVREILNTITDDGIFELHRDYACNIVTAFGHIEGRAVGLLANQAAVNSGNLDAKAAEKAARFIRTCDAFNTPVIDVVDSAGFAESEEEEHSGVIRRGSKLAYAYAEANVPKLTVIVRKAFDSAYVFMGSKDLGADLVFAWPTAQIATSSATEIAQDLLDGNDDDIDAMQQKFIHPYAAAERGLVDAVIPPNETRGQLIEGLRLLGRKVAVAPQKKHGNIAL